MCDFFLLLSSPLFLRSHVLRSPRQIRDIPPQDRLGLDPANDARFADAHHGAALAVRERAGIDVNRTELGGLAAIGAALGVSEVVVEVGGWLGRAEDVGGEGEGWCGGCVGC